MGLDFKFGLGLALLAAAAVGVRATPTLRQQLGWRIPDVDPAVIVVSGSDGELMPPPVGDTAPSGTDNAALKLPAEPKKFAPPPATSKRPAEPQAEPAKAATGKPEAATKPSGLTALFPLPLPAKQEVAPPSSTPSLDLPSLELPDLAKSDLAKPKPAMPDLETPASPTLPSLAGKGSDKPGSELEALVTEFVPFQEPALPAEERPAHAPAVAAQAKETPKATTLSETAKPAAVAVVKPEPKLDTPKPPAKAELTPPLAFPALPPTKNLSAAESLNSPASVLPAKVAATAPAPKDPAPAVSGIPAPPADPPAARPAEPRRVGATAAVPQVRSYDQPISATPAADVLPAGFRESLQPPMHPFFERYRERKEYYVRQGDTLPQIAQWLYQDAKVAEAILRLNPDRLHSATDLRPGMVLRLP